MTRIKIGNKIIGEKYPVYIICEVGSNFDGDLKRAKYLAKLAKDLGADAFKIQNFLAEKIVSNIGFGNLKIAFQKKWDKPVVEIYKNAEFPREWIKEIASHCRTIGIDFLSSPYDYEAVDVLEQVNIPAYKIGSGEIDNYQFLDYVARKKKPIIIATGTATMEVIRKAISIIEKTGNKKIIALQCVTNYPSPIADANIRAMVTIKNTFGVEVGYSDHTVGKEGGGDDPLSGLTIPLGAVALGARVIEKHFTDDRTRKGPDHPFAMDIESFGNMVKGIRAMEKALGDGKKQIMASEKETVIIQRRGIYAAQTIRAGERITKDAIELLRPALGFRSSELALILGKKAKKNISAGNPIYKNDILL